VIADVQMPGMDGFSLTRRVRETPGLEDTIVILLTSAHTSGDAERSSALQVAGHLMKPVKQSELFDTIVRGLRLSEGVASAAKKEVEQTRIPSEGLHILLAEDGLTNQKLAVALLGKLGHKVTIANDGQEAVERLGADAQEYDLVLMDVLMPKLDGLDATRIVRQREQGTNRARCPFGDDRPGHEGRPREMSRRRYGRIPLEADPQSQLQDAIKQLIDDVAMPTIRCQLSVSPLNFRRTAETRGDVRELLKMYSRSKTYLLFVPS